MIGEDGAARLTDFGLARREVGDSSLTADGQVLGTPAYMSPEQARGGGHAVDGRSDVYSLGVVLFQLLSGELPFAGTSRMLMHQLLHDEPRSLRSLNDRVPRDLETICLKAMAREPARRYSNASDMADDLRRKQRGEPIQARPIPPLEKLWRRARRNPALYAARALALLALLSTAAVSALLAVGKSRHARALQEAFEDSEANRLRAERRLAESYLDRGHALCEQGDVPRGLLWLARALETAPEAPPAGNGADAVVLRRVVRLSLEAWGRQACALRAAHAAAEPIHAQAFTADGSTALTVSERDTARLWDTATGRQLAEPFTHSGAALATFSHDGRTGLTVHPESGQARLWHVLTGRSLPLPLLPAGARAIAVAPDGHQLALAGPDTRALLLDTQGGKTVAALDHPEPAFAVDFSPDGKTLATRAGNEVRLWRLDTFRLAGAPLRHARAVLALAFSRDGEKLLTGSEDNTARLWNARTAGPLSGALAHESGVRAVAFSPDGQVVLTESGRESAQLWSVRTGWPLGPPLRHQKQVAVAGFSPDGKRLLVGALDHPALLWPARPGKPLSLPMTHPGQAYAVAFSPEGALLLTAGSDRTARVWDAETGRPIAGVRHEHEGLAAAFSPDGKSALTGGKDQAARRWDVRTGRWLGPPLPHRGWVRAVAFSPEGGLVLTGGVDRAARLWDAASGKPIGPALLHPEEVWAVAFSADGRTARTASGSVSAPVGHACSWPVPRPVEGVPSRVTLWVQVTTGMELDERGTARLLDAAAWRQRAAKMTADDRATR
jgi:WD40 repeat protein